MNKLVERRAFIDSVRLKNSTLKDKFLLADSTTFCVSLVWGEEADCHVVGRVV